MNDILIGPFGSIKTKNSQTGKKDILDEHSAEISIRQFISFNYDVILMDRRFIFDCAMPLNNHRRPRLLEAIICTVAVQFFIVKK